MNLSFINDFSTYDGGNLTAYEFYQVHVLLQPLISHEFMKAKVPYSSK